MLQDPLPACPCPLALMLHPPPPAAPRAHAQAAGTQSRGGCASCLRRSQTTWIRWRTPARAGCRCPKSRRARCACPGACRSVPRGLGSWAGQQVALLGPLLCCCSAGTPLEGLLLPAPLWAPRPVALLTAVSCCAVLCMLRCAAGLPGHGGQDHALSRGPGGAAGGGSRG